MTSQTKIRIEADFGVRGIEKTDIFVYKNDQMIASYYDRSYEDIRKTADQMRARYTDAAVEILCIGEDCMGGSHTWPMDA